MKKTYIAPAITELKMENNTIMAGSTGSGTTQGANIKNLEEANDPFSTASSAKSGNLWDEE